MFYFSAALASGALGGLSYLVGSKDETKREKIGVALGLLSAAGFVASLVFGVAEIVS